ncbi:hypothetical protein [Borreliella yangtzensis]|uniref:Uncharacterized protein n=1 Tax=Borreliella yangtzensis TaxID=683292 RepID=A0ABR6PFW1_9SPIR|nr:hypothetical protein [Borreliella yangtzensis]
MKEISGVNYDYNVFLTIFMIVVPAIFFSMMINKSYEHSKAQGKIERSTLKMQMLLLLLCAFATQIPSTWYSFEDIFTKSYEIEITDLKNQILEELQNKKNFIKAKKEDLLTQKKRTSDLINKRLSNIENLEDKQLDLDPSNYKTMINNIQKKINEIKKENENLSEKIDNIEREFGKLDNELLNFVKEKKEEVVRMQGFYALFGNSSLINRKNYVERFRAWAFLILSGALDFFIGKLLTSIYRARKKYAEEIKQQSKLINENTNNMKLNIDLLASSSEGLVDFSKKSTIQNDTDAYTFNKELFNAIDFICTYLEDNQSTIYSIVKICNKSGKTESFVRRNINLLIKFNLIYLKKRRYILNVREVLQLKRIMEKSNNEKLKTLLSEYKFPTLLTV